MESFFNIAWTVLAVLGVAIAVYFRRRTMPGKKAHLARDLTLFAVLAFLVFPLISISDDIGYFNFYFARTHTPDGALWRSTSRREKHLYAGVVLRVVAVHLLSLSRERVALCWSGLERLTSSQAQHIVSRSVTPAQLRGPPSPVL